jgi:Uma2 family endonuclease
MLPAEVERHRFDVEDYHRMLEAGVLSEDDRVELIRGEIIDMTPIGWRHMNAVNRLTQLLVPLVSGSGYLVSVQNPLRLGPHDEPEPDFALLKDEPRDDLPGPEDAPLVIEVSDSSLAYDREVKLPLYAAAGVEEVWVVDLQSRKVEAHTEPPPDVYRARRVFGAGEEVRSGVIGGLSLPVGEVFG